MNDPKFMRSTSLFFVLLASLWAGFAAAAPWSTVARNGESVVEIDSGSLTRKGQTVRAWSRQVYSDDQPLPLGDPPFRAVRYLYTYECSKRTALLIRRTYVDEQGEPIKDQLLDGLEIAKDIVPGTLQERVYEQACKVAKEAVAHKAPPAKSADKSKAKPAAKAVLAKEGKDDPLAEPASAEPAAEAKKQDEPQPEHTKPKSHAKAAGKRAKPMLVAKAKPAKEEETPSGEQAGAPAGEHEVETSSKEQDKPEQVAVSEKNSKHDVSEECDHCEDDETVAEDKPGKPLPPAHWDYQGNNGPQNWGKLSPEFAACGSGKYQSPIDIKDGIRLSLEPIEFDYKPSALRILDNGHTVQINYAPGSSITVNGEKYTLAQFHFHKPSEERIAGKAFDMVVHLVHKNVIGQLAVVAVMLRNGAPNPLIQTLWTHLPLQPGKEGGPRSVKIEAAQLLPADRAYYTFMGSLTEPPCTEGVLWVVMKNPMQVSRSQIAAFGHLYEANARPVQPTNRRLIKESL
jgi:carbonic anhydrase